MTFPYKVLINNHSVTIEGNPILFNCIQGFHSKLWHITAFLNIECKKYKNLETKRMTTSPGLPYSFRFKEAINATMNTLCFCTQDSFISWRQGHQKSLRDVQHQRRSSFICGTNRDPVYYSAVHVEQEEIDRTNRLSRRIKRVPIVVPTRAFNRITRETLYHTLHGAIYHRRFINA